MFGEFQFGEPYFGEVSDQPVVAPPSPAPGKGDGRPEKRRRRIPRIFEWRPSYRRQYVQEISGQGAAIRAAGQSQGLGTIMLVSGSGRAIRGSAFPAKAQHGRNLAPVLASGRVIAPQARSLARGRRVLDTRWEEEAVALLLLDD